MHPAEEPADAGRHDYWVSIVVRSHLSRLVAVSRAASVTVEVLGGPCRLVEFSLKTLARGQCSSTAHSPVLLAQSCLVLKTLRKLVSCKTYVTVSGNSANSFAFSSATS